MFFGVWCYHFFLLARGGCLTIFFDMWCYSIFLLIRAACLVMFLVCGVIL